METSNVLIVDDNIELADTATELFAHYGFATQGVYSAAAALAVLKGGGIDLVFSDIQLGHAETGIWLAQQIREFFPEVVVVLTTAYNYDVNPEFDPPLLTIRKPYLASDMAETFRLLLKSASLRSC